MQNGFSQWMPGEMRLTPGVTYEFWIVGRNSQGDGLVS